MLEDTFAPMKTLEKLFKTGCFRRKKNRDSRLSL